LVKGTTVHSALGLLPKTKPEDVLKRKNDEGLNRRRHELRNVRVVLLEEVSMISWVMFWFIDKRLRQIFCRPNQPFAGLHVLIVGDLYVVLL
jgi:ATP-dependent DNA helicase PIF1